MRLAACLAFSSCAALAQPAEVAKSGNDASPFLTRTTTNRSVIAGTHARQPFNFLPAEQSSPPAVAVDARLNAPPAAPKVVRGADGSLRIVQ